MSVKIIQLNENAIKNELKESVLNRVGKTLNSLPGQEAHALTNVNAAKHERSEERRNFSSSHYESSRLTGSGDAKLKVPKLEDIAF